ncbi:unnamed protein product [Phytophthora lilii]|uniref:Unnamed protein product n=1 Tax=Phytophthora lilii TaxID=2077276 RepID=A0A9W6TVB5_9STRA|nr:unnamed protein product [Phytophthora lilii]
MIILTKMQACHLPNVNPSNPGKMIDFIAHPDLVNNFPEQITPFRCFGCDFSEPYSGTIFRLALRTEEQAQHSKLSNRAQTPAKLVELLKEFADGLPTVLLFLRNVCKISVWEWKSGEQDPTLMQEVLIKNMTSEIKAKRSLQHTSLGSSRELSTQQFSTEGIVNGYFELSSNRRDIWFGEGLSGDGLLRAQWNIALLRDVIAPCYARAILHLAKSETLTPERHVLLLPQALPPAPWDSLTYSFFSLIRSTPCLYSDVGGGRWVSPTESMVIRSSYTNSKQLEQLLIDDGFPVVRNMAEDLERVLVKTGTIPSYVEPQAVREAYKRKRSVHAGDREATKCLLSFILSDIDQSCLSVLVGVNFLPVADGSIQTFNSCSKFNPSELEDLCSMGFSRQHAVYALAVAGSNGVETALNWLLQNPNPSIVNEGASTTFLIPSREELDLLEKARSHLVDIEAVTSKGLVLLSSDVAAKELNLRKLDYQGFEDMLAVVLPAGWFGKLTVPWSVASTAYTPNKEWFRRLWRYIGTSNHLSAFKDKWPIVPTSSNVLTQLSTSAGVLSAELIPDGCLRCLEKLQVRLLLPNLFASFQPSPDVWQYIHQPTAAGVLACIGVIIASSDLAVHLRVNNLFEHADRFDREHLLRFLMSGVIEDSSANQKQICCSLPIFPGFRSAEHFKDSDLRWADSDDISDNIDSSFSPSFVSLTEIKEMYQEPMLCMGVAPKFLDENFVFVKEGDSELAEFLTHLGVRRVSKVDFFAKHLIPRFNRIEPKARVKFVYELLTELTILLAQDHEGVLSSIIETAPMFPTMKGNLKSIADLYDPEIDEFMEIMDESFFPALELQDPQPLAVLRSIGLQRSLSRRSILSLAISLENDQMAINAGYATQSEQANLDKMCKQLRSRSLNFFQYVDMHIDQLVTPTPLQRQRPTQTKRNKKSKGIRFLRNFLGDDHLRGSDTEQDNNVLTSEELEEQAMEKAEIDDFNAKLAIIMWIPVCEEKPHSAAPWFKEGDRIIVASPQQSRPTKLLWLCSSQFHIIKCNVRSDVLKGVLGWDKHLPVETIASQLKEISRMFDTRQEQGNSSVKSADGDTHVIWSAVYNIYQVLSTFFETDLGERREKVLSILTGNGKYVWVGDRFVSASHVATVAVVNAEPYIYTVPNELLHFRPFLRAIGVRERFVLVDYVQVLGAMYKEGLDMETTGTDNTRVASLSADKLTTVIGLVQLISDTLQHHTDYELFAPDRNGVLDFAANLTYDDAPWLDKRDYETSSGSTRFIHPKISNEVAAKIGSRSLRSQLLSESGHEAMSFTAEEDVEAFGQTEALTKRIAHILEQYPDGPNIISELIQNADDAGASRVCVLYNSCTFQLVWYMQMKQLTILLLIVFPVVFDPHATHLPGISAANPGIKIRFANANIVKQFPDQFAPFKGVFGCDLSHRYKGTLFRFPLRNNTLAESSEIKRRGYSHHEIVNLFRSFQGSIIDTMLFLRNVCKVEVYLQSEVDQPPVLLYGAEVPKEDRGESWKKIDRFMRNTEFPRGISGATELSAKRDFYARLRSTPAEELPSVTRVLHFRRQQQKCLFELFRRFDSEAVKSDGDKNDQIEETTEKYLVCNQIGGGKAREMACAAENESLKLIPWVGIASRIDGVATDGRAFCFLPLPVRVGLPVHINGYFELSSNRRDIWVGDDMTGDGKLRSEWNANLLVDAVAPAYLTFLLEAKSMCGDSSQYLSFFPTKLPASPWDSIVLELFRIMKSQPVFFALATSGMNNAPLENSMASVTPDSCVLVDDNLSNWETLEMALGPASLATVLLPETLRKLLVQLDAVYGAMTPDFFRQLTRRGNFLSALDQDGLIRVVQFCLSDCSVLSSPQASEALDQLPLLPLKDGKFGRFYFMDNSLDGNTGSSRNQQLTYFFGNGMEEQLLAEFPHRVVRGEFKQLFDQLPLVYENSNLRVVDLDVILNNFLPHVLGRCWSKTQENVFTLESSSQLEGSQPREEWIRLLWTYVETQLQKIEQLPSVFMKWPLVPVICAEGSRWVCLSANVSLLLPHSEKGAASSELLWQLQPALDKVGIFIIDTSYVSGEKSAQWLQGHKYAHRLTSNGLLAALSRYQFLHERQSFDDIFAAATNAERLVLCDFFSQNTFEAVSDDFQTVLSELPIFPVHTKPNPGTVHDQNSNEMPFVNLRRGGFLPHADADPRILDDSFYRAEKDTTRRFLRDYGVDEWSYTTILMDHVFPQLATLEAQNGDLVDSIVVGALEALPFHQRNDPRFREVVKTQAIIPSRKRVFRVVNQLHDPTVSELSELVGENSLPAHAFCSPTIVDTLRSLGLRTGLSCHAVLESARSIETMYMEDHDGSVDRACLKAHSLLKVVNSHFDAMMAEINSSKPATEDEGIQDSNRVTQDIVTELKEVQWMPVRLESAEGAMPWKRPTDGELTSKELISAFGWDVQVDPLVIAKQLEAIGLQWEQHHQKQNGALGHPPLSWRFPLAEVHQMYEMLESYRLSDEEGWKTSSVHRKLANALWIWTGKGFAYPCQLAVDADASLEPLLYCCPSEHIISRSLLASFDLKDAFTTADYLEAILRLPRNSVLSEKQVLACLKIYDIIGKDSASLESTLTSFVPQDMVILDQSNRLIPAVQLTFDDMEWNESREVRRGATFVSKKVPKIVAGLLGATSLHSKLAQTSVTSRRVVCPPVGALQSVLPPRSGWYRTFLWETILAAERFGGTQVDFFLDCRHHSSQRVIQPSLQPLQDEALCIHIHDVVLSENDINNLFHGESSRAGLLCGFIASDCMQILSGEGFYILDPTGCYLASSAATTAASTSASGQGASIGRRYEVLSQDFVRYPDQLLPFTTLPSCPSNVSRGTQSTLIRFPCRKTGSAVSPYVLDARKTDKLVAFIKSQLYQTLIFTESVHRISLWSVGKESEFASHCHGEVSLDAPERTLRKRNMTRLNQEWKKKFSLQSFFKSPVIPENQMEFLVNLELENRQHQDTWLFADNIGMGRGRDLACTAVHEMLHSTPYVSIACHIFRDGVPAPRLRGHIFKIVDTQQQVGLPVHINGCFKKSMKDKQLPLAVGSSNPGGREGEYSGASGSEQQVAAGWNRILLEDGAADAYVKLLMVAKRRLESSFPNALYNIWPTSQKLSSIGQRLSSCFGWNEHSGMLLPNRVSADILNSPACLQVASFAQLHFPAFNVPTRVLQDCSRLLPSRIYAVTPKVMRRFLRSVSSAEVQSDVCLSLLEYCLSDLPFPLPSETDPVWAEFHGLSLLPLEDGSIGVLRVNQRRSSYVLASFNQLELLRPLGNLFVSLVAYQRLYKYFTETRFTAVFGLASFSIKTLSDNIERVLPPSWKNQTIVNWDPSSPIEIDELWLYRFWQVVHFERRSLAYFANWPLIPVKGSRLVSCGKMDMAVCVWDGSADSTISTQVIEAFQVSVTHQEDKMADMEVERKRLIELSSAKLQKEEELAEDSDNDAEEAESEEEDVDNEDDTEITGDDDKEASSGSDDDVKVSTVEITSPTVQNRELREDFPDNEDDTEAQSSGSISLELENLSAGEEDGVNVDSAVIGEGFAIPVYPVEDELHEFCSRETLHNVLMDLNVTMMELAYLSGQERDIVPRSADVGLVVLNGFFASSWDDIRWRELSEVQAVLIAEFFSHNGDTYGGYNRMQLEKLKQLPIYINVRSVPCAIHTGQDFFLIPPELNLTNIPLPPDAQQCFLKSNPRLNGFYKELGVEEMSDSKLLIYVLPMFSELLEPQRDQILQLLLQKWQTLRGNAELTTLLRASPLFRDNESDNPNYHPASAYCDPRNSVLATIYDGVRGQFPAQRYRTSEWLDLMGEIGLQTDVTVDIFVECAQRIDGQCSNKQVLSPEDEHLISTLHQFFVQNFDKFDRSLSFFEKVAPLAFVPAVVWEASSVWDSSTSPGQQTAPDRQDGQFTSRSVVRRYSDCAVPDDQALVYSTMPIISNIALPPRVLYSRLGIQSPPLQKHVVDHLLSITNGDRVVLSRSLDWQFFLPIVEVFQTIFKFLQNNWDDLEVETQQLLSTAAVIPVGSTLVKGSRLFFHLGENLAPLLFEVPRAFGAYDTLFRHMGSKEAPEVCDYIRLLRDLNEECCGHPLNVNELIAAARAIDLLATAVTESNHNLSLEEKNSIFLPSGVAVMQSMLVMAYNDSAALYSSIDLTELHVVHPRISTRCCKILGVPGLTSVVTEELDDRDNQTELLASDDIAHFNSVLNSQHFADGLRKIITAQQQKASSHDAFGFIPNFEDLNQRIVNLATYEVKSVVELHSRFIAKLDFPARKIDVTKSTHKGSLYFLDQTSRRIYIAKRSFESRLDMGMRSSHLVARCINQLLGGVLQDCSVLESILTCDEMAIPEVLQLLDIYEDPMLIVEKLRGVLGQPLSEADCATVELAPLRSCLPGELVAVEDESGTLCYGKILREEPSEVTGVSRYEVKMNSSSTQWILATQLYFFRSARVGTSGGDSSSSSTTATTSEQSGLQAEGPVSNPPESFSLPASVVALSADSSGGEIVSGFSGTRTPSVSRANVLSAVNDLLSRLNVTLDSSVEDLMAENLRLQRRFDAAETARRAATAQIDSAIREKKEVQDSLMCAVCLENQQRLRDLLGEPLSAADRASVRQTPLLTCVPGEIVAVEGSDGTLRYGKVQDEEGPGEVKVQVSKACIRWYALSQIYFFQAVGARKDKLGDDQPTETEKLDDRSLTLDVVAEVNALLARLNVSLSTSYEDLLAEVLRLQHQAALADEDRRAAWKQVEQAMRQKTDAEKALVCVICLVKTVDRVLIPCGHSYCSACSCNAKKLQQLVRQESDSDVQTLLDQPHPAKGTTPLMVAATKKYGVETVRALIELGADMEVTDTGKYKNTALHYAAYNNRVSQLEMLLDAGANIFALNGKGHTALDVARLRGRKEAATALTSQLQLHSGWLYLRSKSMLGFWKRRWCVLLWCNSKRTTSELCIFRGPDKVHPDAVIWQDSLADTTNCSTFSDGRANGFRLDTRVIYQRMSSRRYSRYKSSGRTHVHKANMQPREYIFACDTGTSRDAWMRALGSRQWGGECTNTTVSSTYVGSPHRASTRSRAATVDAAPLPSTAPPPEDAVSTAQADKLGALVSPDAAQPIESRARASAPTFVEDENGFVWGDLPAPQASPAQEVFPLATVITISSDPNEPQPLLRDRCIVCAENHRDSVCIPCGHVAGCYDCIRAFTQENPWCPACRAHVDGVVRIQD